MTEKERKALMVEANEKLANPSPTAHVVDQIEMTMEKTTLWKRFGDFFHSEPVRTIQSAAIEQAQVQTTQMAAEAARAVVFTTLEELTPNTEGILHDVVRSKGFRTTSTLVFAGITTPWAKKLAAEYEDSDPVIASAFEIGSNIPITMFLQEGGDFIQARETIRGTIEGGIRAFFAKLREKSPQIDAAVEKHVREKEEYKNRGQFKGNKR